MLRDLQRASPHWHRNRSKGNTGTGGGHQLLCHGLQRQPRCYFYFSSFLPPVDPIPFRTVDCGFALIVRHGTEHWPGSTSCSSFLWSVPWRNGATNAIMAIKSDDADDDGTFRRWNRDECVRYLNVSSKKGRWILAEKIWVMATQWPLLGAFLGEEVVSIVKWIKSKIIGNGQRIL